MSDEDSCWGLARWELVEDFQQVRQFIVAPVFVSCRFGGENFHPLLVIVIFAVAGEKRQELPRRRTCYVRESCQQRSQRTCRNFLVTLPRSGGACVRQILTVKHDGQTNSSALPFDVCFSFRICNCSSSSGSATSISFSRIPSTSSALFMGQTPT